MAESVELFCSFHKLSSFGAKYSRRTTPKPTASVLHASDSSSRRNYGLCCRALDAKSVDGGEMFSLTSSSKSDVDYLGESTKGDLNVKKEHLDAFGLDGQFTLDGPIEEIARVEAREAEMLLGELGIVDLFSSRHSPRGIFCSRTLNLRSISAIGYDMDYTLIHYNVMAWEGRAYDYGMANLKSMGFPVDGLEFDPNLVIRGLIMDKERGNLVKADRFGYVKRAMHGTRMLQLKLLVRFMGENWLIFGRKVDGNFLILFSLCQKL